MTVKLRIKGPGMQPLIDTIRALQLNPSVKLGVLQDSGSTVRTKTTSATSNSRVASVTVNARKGTSRGNFGAGQRSRGNFGAGTERSASGRTNNRGENITNAELAAIHEFGAPSRNIPERSFLRSTANAQGKAWVAFLGRALRANLNRGGNPSLAVLNAFELLGLKAVADIQRTIRAGIAPPLAPATIRRKGSSKPLIDTGRLLQSISHQAQLRPAND